MLPNKAPNSPARLLLPQLATEDARHGEDDTAPPVGT
jgi:hypothetical protein